VIDCGPPEIVEVPTFSKIDPELTLIHENPSVPYTGVNAVLLDWSQACAGNVKLYTDQMKKIRETQN